MDAVYVESQTFDSLRLTKKQFDKKYKFDLAHDADKLDPQTVEDIRDQEDVQVSRMQAFFLKLWVSVDLILSRPTFFPCLMRFVYPSRLHYNNFLGGQCGSLSSLAL